MFIQLDRFSTSVLGKQLYNDKFYQLTHTLNLTFLYVTVSTLNPTVGMVVTDCPNFNLYKIAVIKEMAKK